MVAHWATMGLNLVALHKSWLPRVCFKLKDIIQMIDLSIKSNGYPHENDLSYNIDQEIKHLFKIFWKYLF